MTMTTPEDRIRAHQRALRRRWDYRNSGLPAMWLYLARRWKRPIREIKAICGKAP